MSGRSERAEAVRALVREASHGLLSTNGLEPAGFPYGSLAPLAATEACEPVMLISHLAQHTKNLAADPRASVLILAKVEGDPQQAPRASLIGTARLLAGAEEEAMKRRFLAVHPGAETYFDLNFQLWVLRPEEARYIGGFGAAAWVSGSEIVGA